MVAQQFPSLVRLLLKPRGDTRGSQKADTLPVWPHRQPIRTTAVAVSNAFQLVGLPFPQQKEVVAQIRDDFRLGRAGSTQFLGENGHPGEAE